MLECDGMGRTEPLFLPALLQSYTKRSLPQNYEDTQPSLEKSANPLGPLGHLGPGVYSAVQLALKDGPGEEI